VYVKQRRLTNYEREIIEANLASGKSSREIAKMIGRNHTVVSREIKRNKGQLFPYSSTIAQTAADRRAKITNTRKLNKDWRLQWYVTRRLEDHWSPEQIAGRMRLEQRPVYVCAESIYQYIYDEQKGAPWLYHELRRAHPVRQMQGQRKPNKRTLIPDRTPISVRSEVINQRLRYGDWESDGMEFARKKPGLVSVQKERKSQLLRLTKLESKHARETRRAIEDVIEELPTDFIHSITFDNGGEAAEHNIIKQEYCIETYFCKPYSPWQKGSVENIIGLTRQYLPKKSDITDLTSNGLYVIQESLNNRPRKLLQYQTPNEIFKQITKSGALNPRT
jgi:IS30 family transposase